MDDPEKRVEERPRRLPEMLGDGVGPVDKDALWTRLRSEAAGLPVRRRRDSRSARWAAAVAVLAIALTAAPFALRRGPGPAERTRADAGGSALRIGRLVSAVDFLSLRDGWVAVRLPGQTEQSALLETSDGGRSWVLRRLPVGFRGYDVVAIHVSDGGQGDLIVQRQGLTVQRTAFTQIAILATRDGGRHWRVAYKERASRVGGSPVFRSFGSVGYAFDGVHVLKTTGGTWSTVALPPGMVAMHVDFISGELGYVAGTKCPAGAMAGASIPPGSCPGVLLRTADGGRSWSTAFTAPNSSPSYAAVSFANAQVGWFYDWNIATFTGRLYHTTDGGMVWTLEQPQLIQGRAYAFSPTFTTPEVGWLPVSSGAGPIAGGLLITRDGGRNWREVGRNRFWSLSGVSLLSPKVGFVAGENMDAQEGFLARTTDGGRTWTQMLPAVAPTGFADFVSTRQGLAIGTASDPQAFLQTADSGRHWSVLDRLPQNAMGLSFISPSLGYAVAAPRNPGTSMQILRTTDGGRRWQVRANLTANPSALELFATSPYVQFFNRRQGILETEQDLERTVLEATGDGGRTWHTVATLWGVSGGSEFSFLSLKKGYVLTTGINKLKAGSGAGGGKPSAGLTLHRTTDGGRTWRRLPGLPMGDIGQGVCFISDEVGWVAVQSPPGSPHPQTVILRTTDGGRSWASYPMPGPVLQPTGENGLQLHFVNREDGWLVGDGQVFRTTNGGRTWRAAP